METEEETWAIPVPLPGEVRVTEAEQKPRRLTRTKAISHFEALESPTKKLQQQSSSKPIEPSKLKSTRCCTIL